MLTLNAHVAVAVPATIVLATTLSLYGGGVQSGRSGVPAGASQTMPSCQACHSGSGPSASRTNAPTTTLTVTDRVLQPSQQISMTTSVTGGVNGTDGGFLCEASAGTFTAGTQTRVITNPSSITHDNDLNRSWTYTYTAPTAPGLVTVTSVAMTCDGSSNSGDMFAFSGYDPNATVATPVRMFVLPQGVVDQGVACPDGYGNHSVLGANSAPTVGNAGFAFELHGASPGSIAFLIGGFNPPNFTPIDLGATFGLTGCHGYVATAFLSLLAPTSAGSAMRAEGSATFPLAIPSTPGLAGISLDVQGAYVDPTAASMLGRSKPLSFSNGLRVTFL